MEPELWTARFDALAAQAADVGARLGLEFFPSTTSRTLHDGLRLVADAGHDAGGLVIDMWHVARAHTPVGDLASVPLNRIVGVELNDADRSHRDVFEDTLHRRRYCGEGAFDLTGMINALRAAGWNGPWGGRDPLRGASIPPVPEALARAAATTRQLEAASTAGV